MFDIIRNQLSRTVPFARHVGITVEDVHATGATTGLAEAPQLNNHVGILHAGAVFTLCESASGAALAGALLPVIMKARFVVRHAHIDYLKPAKGELRAQARLQDDGALLVTELLAELQRAGRIEVAVEVIAQDASDEVVATARFHWAVRLPSA